MTINRAQGQPIAGSLGFHLTSPCFSRGQLYVALFRKINPRNVFILAGNSIKKAKNEVYLEALRSHSRFKVERTVCIRVLFTKLLQCLMQ